jgi:hypothetical protein
MTKLKFPDPRTRSVSAVDVWAPPFNPNKLACRPSCLTSSATNSYSTTAIISISTIASG